jgi:hypothetical protein
MRISTTARVWFGFLAALGVKRVHEEYRARRAEVESSAARFHGYTWDQVNEVIRLAYKQRPDIERGAAQLPVDERNRFIAGLFTCSRERFLAEFGVERPPPR